VHQQEEVLLEQLKASERELHERLVEATRQLKLARQEVASCESKLQLTMAQLNHVRRQMDVLWNAAP
jgi:hypothetical protein